MHNRNKKSYHKQKRSDNNFKGDKYSRKEKHKNQYGDYDFSTRDQKMKKRKEYV